MTSQNNSIESLAKLKNDYRLYFKKCLRIRNKQSDIVEFVPNKSQDKLIDIVEEWKAKYPNPKQRPTLYIVIPKPRQVGFSTATEGIFFHDLNFGYNKVAMIISYDTDSAVVINDMSNRFYQYLPQVIKPMRRKSQGKGILFENPNFNSGLPVTDKNKPGLQSKFLIETANNINAGSSYTINYLHISELAKWNNPEETLTSLLQSVPKNDAIVVVESTAKGLNYFYNLCRDARDGKNNYKLLFIPWHEHEEYQSEYTGFELTDEEKELKECYNLTLEQLQWRRDTLQNKCQNNEDIFHQEYPSYLEEAFVTTGKPVFEISKVMARMQQLKPPLKQGYFDYRLDAAEKVIESSIKWVDSNSGFIKIYEDVKQNYPYVIGGDTAGDGSDSFIGQVLDNTTGKQVAVLRHKLDEDLYANQMYCLGKYYNVALLGIEANYSTHPIKELQRMGYTKQYMRETEDSLTNQIVKKYGFRTDKLTRPVIIAELVQIVREHIDLINDYDTLQEMITFVRNEAGRPEAMSGEHDDCIMALAIAYYIRDQQAFTVKSTPKFDLKKLSIDLQQDYNNANKSQKEYLKDKWIKLGLFD